uniref:Uncharacterized protein n=1 Tax=Cucumis sativus TaxID=3659 RepID=A0A0A0K9B6_CUCSA
MPFRRVLRQLPNKLRRKCSVIVLLNFRIQLLHPTKFHKQFREIFVHFLENPFLYAVPKFPIAVFLPQIVNGFQILGGNELNFGEIDVPSFQGAFAGEGDQKPAGLLVGLPKVFGA